jgi:proton glutamate symport protein
MDNNRSLWVALGSVAFVGLLHAVAQWLPDLLDATFLSGARWYAIAALCWFGYQKKNITTWILIAMAIGVEIGVDFPKVGANLDVLSKIFIQLIKAVIAPLLFSTLVIGIAGQSSSKQLGRISVKAFSYFIGATSVALVVGLVAINLTRAGDGIRPTENLSTPVAMTTDVLTAQVDSVKGTVKLMYKDKELAPPPPVVKQDWKKILLHTFPENVSKMIYEGAALQIVVFSLLFGLGMRMSSDKHRTLMLNWCEALSEIMFKFTALIMYFAPFAVAGALAFTIGTMGFKVVIPLLKLLGTLYAALIAFVILVFIPVMLFFKIPIVKFFKAIYEPASLAFGTASSEAAMPRAISAMQEFGVPYKIVSFVMPTGYSFNLDGSTLYLALASVFCAQAAGMELSIGTQLTMMATLLLTSKGVAAVPRASLVILAATLNQFHIPEWPIAVILGIDALMDMGRTTINLMGNCLASAVVARWEGEFDDSKS